MCSKNNPRKHEGETREGIPVGRSTQMNMKINKQLGIHGAVQGAAWSWNNICQMSSLDSWPVLLLSFTAGNVSILSLGIQTWLLHCSKGICHVERHLGKLSHLQGWSYSLLIPSCLLCFIRTVGKTIHSLLVQESWPVISALRPSNNLCSDLATLSICPVSLYFNNCTCLAA